MQDKRVYLSQEMSAEQVAAQIDNWDAVYSGTTLRSALRRLLPRAMLGNHSGSINSDENVRGCLNELEDTATSSRSSFADLWDSTNVEIRDQGSHEKGDLNETTNLLLTCKRQVIYPYFYMLSLVSWRPFHIQSYHYQGCSIRKILNILYTLFIFLLIIFSYASSIIACQARLEVKPESTFAPPVTIQAITIHPITHRNVSTTPTTNQTNVTTAVKPTRAMEQYKIINSNNSQYSTASSNSSDWIKLSSTTIPSTSEQKTRTYKVITFVPIRTAGPVWKPAVTECTHIVSTYVVPNVLHFMAFLIGFYMFRIQENEGLHALIEKVFLLSSVPKKIVSRLRFFLFGGIVMAILGVGNFILFCFAFSLDSVTGFRYNKSAQWAVACLMVLGQIVELCVSVVTIVNYCAQCELLIFYLREIGLRMEEKTKDLSIIMKDILEVKKNFSRVNGLISVIATLVVFNYFELAVIGVLNLAIYLSQVDYKTQLMYRVFAPLIFFTMVIFPITIAARLTAAARHFKQKSLQTRVFGYPSASQLDLDSFVLFTHSVDMKAKLLFMPVQGSFLSGVAALLVFVLLLMLQSGVIAGSNMYL